MINKQNTTRYSYGASHGGGGSPPRLPIGGDFDGEVGVHAIWEAVKTALRVRVSSSAFDAWIANLEVIAEVGGAVLIAAPGEHALERVRTTYEPMIQDAWYSADEQRREIQVEARANIPADIMALAVPFAAPAEAAGVDGEPVVEVAEPADPRIAKDEQTLESFLVGDSNKAAFGLIQRLTQGGEVSSPILTLVGSHGVGKSHVLKAAQRKLEATCKPGEVLYFGAEDFTAAYIEGVKRKDTSELRAAIRKAKYLFLDDLQFICTKPGTLSEFFGHLRANVAKGGYVIMSCDKSPAVLELDQRMRDEILGGVVVPIDMPDRNLRKEIVKAKAEAIARDDAEFIFPEDWVELVADRLPMSGRALYGAVRNVFVWTRLGDDPLTRATVEKAVQLQLGGVSMRPPSIATIKEVTAKAYEVTRNDLESGCRKRVYALPRQYAMYLARKMTSCSYPQIGRHFGDRDHTTVLFAFRKIKKLIAENPALDEELRQLEQRIQSDPRNFR